MKTAKEILTSYSDGDYTLFQGYGNILLAMEEYANIKIKEAKRKEKEIEKKTKKNILFIISQREKLRNLYISRIIYPRKEIHDSDNYFMDEIERIFR